jgi:hypothetical protein
VPAVGDGGPPADGAIRSVVDALIAAAVSMTVCCQTALGAGALR